MRPNPVKRKLREGGVALGTFLFEFDTTGIARIAAAAGAEFTVFDMEHTGWSVETVRRLMATVGSALVPLVRIPATEYHFVARTLDMGAMGVMVPMVESGEQARRIVEFSRYPPRGRRGAAFTIAHDDYTGGDVAAKIASCDAEQLIIVQIETAAGLAHVDEIASVDGVDVLWVGQYDLTSSLGIAGQFEHSDFQRALERVASACREHGKTAGFMVLDAAAAQAMLQQGYRMLAYSGDLWIYQTALKRGLDQMRDAAERHPRT